MTEKLNKRGRRKTKDRVSTSIFLDRDLHEWTVGKNRSDIVNEAVRKYKNGCTTFFESDEWVNDPLSTGLKLD